MNDDSDCKYSEIVVKLSVLFPGFLIFSEIHLFVKILNLFPHFLDEDGKFLLKLHPLDLLVALRANQLLGLLVLGHGIIERCTHWLISD